MRKDPRRRLVKMYDRPGYLLRRAYQISMGAFELECRELALTPAQFAVLVVLAATSDIDQAGLARALGYDKVTMMYVLRGMDERGLVRRQATTGRGRSIAVSLTKAGLALLEEAQKPTELASQTLLAPFTEAQSKQFIKLLKILNASLEEKARAPLVLPVSVVEDQAAEFD